MKNINNDYNKNNIDNKYIETFSKDSTLNVGLNKHELTPAQLAEMSINSLFKNAQHDCVDIITPSKKITLERNSYKGISTNVDHSNLLVFKFEGQTTVIISQEFVVEGYDLL